jgi:hypothetical protein
MGKGNSTKQTKFTVINGNGEGTTGPKKTTSTFASLSGGMTSPADVSTASSSHIVDFDQVRTQRLEEKKRKTERVMLREWVGVSCVGANLPQGMKSLEVIDLSEDGLAFRVPVYTGKGWPKEITEIQVRFYFTKDSFIPLKLAVQNIKTFEEDGVRYVRCGCTVDPVGGAYEAFACFVKFLKSYSMSSYTDRGDSQAFYI